MHLSSGWSMLILIVVPVLHELKLVCTNYYQCNFLYRGFVLFCCELHTCKLCNFKKFLNALSLKHLNQTFMCTTMIRVWQWNGIKKKFAHCPFNEIRVTFIKGSLSVSWKRYENREIEGSSLGFRAIQRRHCNKGLVNFWIGWETILCKHWGRRTWYSS